MPGGQPKLGTAARPGPGASDHGPGQYPGPRAMLSARPVPRGNGPRRDAEKDTAAIRQEATAMRDAAQKEAAHLRAVILSLSEQLSQLSAYIRENLASPGGLATMPAPAFAPPRPRTRPNAPAARPARPRTAPTRPARPGGLAGPKTAPAKKTATRGRQLHAMRIATAATATLFAFAVVMAAVEIGTFGFKFFVFRTAVGESAPTVPTDQQFLAQEAAAAKAAAHKVHTPGRHSAKSTHRDSQPTQQPT
jgi:hypothetical protein